MAGTVILGAGIIGLSTAYYLSEHQPGSTIHLVDPSPTLFSSASGYAAGFIAAKGWFGHKTIDLAQLSFAEHQELADKNKGGELWGYSKSVYVDYGTSSGTREHKQEGHNDQGVPQWLRVEDGHTASVPDDEDSHAIVDPLKLCEFLFEKCTKAGVQIHQPATALSVIKDMRGEIASVTIGSSISSDEVNVPATRILIAAGAWSGRAFTSLFDTSSFKLAIGCAPGHSLVVKNPGADNETCHAVFLSSGRGDHAEMFSRKNGVIYIAGVNPSVPLPGLATDAEPVPEAIERLKALARTYINSDSDTQVLRTGLCFRPTAPGDVPIMARVKDEDLGAGISTRPGAEGGVFVAAGHGPWGISLSLGTGKVMAELMQGREQSADIQHLGLDR